MTISWLRRAYVWLRRIGHCRGFGIQSPTDYRFVRQVINEHWPYYAYEELGRDDDWLHRKLGRLCFRLANERQPQTIVSWAGYHDYLQAGCRKAWLVEEACHVDMAVVSIKTDYKRLFQECNDQSLVVFMDIWQYPEYWRCIIHDEQVTLSFDLYYCGIVMFDPKRKKQHYIINF